MLVQGDLGMGQQAADEGGRVEPRALRPKQCVLLERDAGQCGRFFGGNGAVEVRMAAVLCKRGIAFAFGFAVVQVEDAAALPHVFLLQQALQQAAGVAVAREQQFGLCGVVRGDFGV